MARTSKPNLSSAPRAVVVPRLLRRSEAAIYIGVSCSQLDLIRQRGDLRVVPVPSERNPTGASRVPLFDRFDLDALIETWKGRDV